MHILNIIRSHDPHVRHFARIFDGHKIAGMEQSLKITSTSVFKDRVLIAINTDDIYIDQVFDICNFLSMGNVFLEQISALIPRSKQIAFAIEVGAQVSYRIYFELKKKERPHGEPWGITLKKLAIISVKWSKTPSTTPTKTLYYLLDDFSFWIAQDAIFFSSFGKTFDFLDKILREGNAKIIIADDAESCRRSFDFMTNFSLDDLSDDFYRFAGKNPRYFTSLFDGVPIHHVSGGTDKNGDRFITIYFKIYPISNHNQ